MLLADLSDSELLSQIQGVVGSRNRATARLLEYLAEVEARKLHLKEAYASIYEFCLRKLGFSEGSAVRHIAAARACRRFPLALEFVRNGRIHLTGMALLKAHLTDDNHLELLTAAAGRSKAEIELLLRTRNPRPDVPESIRPVFSFAAAGGCTGGAARAGFRDADCPGDVRGVATESGAGTNSAHSVATGSASTNMNLSERGRVAPLSAERFHVEFTMNADTKDKLERVLDLMSHANPKRSLATAFDRALDVLLRDLEKKRLGKTSRPRKSRGVKHGNVARSTLREVYERDGVQCAFVSETGVRCASQVFLQTDHVIARALGGSGAAHNARVLCQPHNRFEAERTFGAKHVARRIEEQRSRSRSCRLDAGASASARGTGFSESGNHLRQERVDDECGAGASASARGTGFSESGNHLRQERVDDECAGNRLREDREEKADTGSGHVPCAIRDDSSCHETGCPSGAKCKGQPVERAAHGANAAEVRGKLFAALTTMGFRRAETRNAIGRLEQRSELVRVPIDALLRQALALLTR